MREWFASHSGLEQVFLLCAIVGGVVVLFRFLLNIMGLDNHEGGLDGHHADSDVGFQLLTIQGVSSFFAMFGLVGYSLHHNASFGMLVSLVCAVVAGLAAVWIIQRIFLSMLGLQSSGSLGLDAAVGSEGSVYLTVSPGGGRVQINFANRLREFEAVTANGETLPTGTAIRVQSVSANALVVSKI